MNQSSDYLNQSSCDILSVVASTLNIHFKNDILTNINSEEEFSLIPEEYHPNLVITYKVPRSKIHLYNNVHSLIITQDDKYSIVPPTEIADVGELKVKSLVCKDTEFINVDKVISLTYLDCAYRSVENINTLVNLKELYCSFTDVTNISNLTNLEKLYCWGCPYISGIGNLHKLTHLNIGDINGSNTSFVPLNEITSKKHLVYLNIGLHYATDDDIIEIGKMNSLETLEICNFTLSHVDGLSELKNIKTLRIDISTLKDISKLSKLTTLTNLSCAYSRVSDVSMFGYLHTLDCSYTDVTDVSMLGNLYALKCNNTKIVDVSALGKLYSLNCCRTSVKDVSMLGNLHTLLIRDTNVTDVSALSKLHNLDCCFTNVSDVSMLGNLHKLNCDRTKVSDVSMLNNVPLLSYYGTPAYK